MSIVKKISLILLTSLLDAIIIGILLILIVSILLVHVKYTYFNSGVELENYAEMVVPSIVALLIYSTIYIPLRYFFTKCILRLSFNQCVLPVLILIIFLTAMPLLIDGILVIFGSVVLHGIYAEAIALNGAYIPYDSFDPLGAIILLFMGLVGGNLRCQMLFHIFRDKTTSEAKHQKRKS